MGSAMSTDVSQANALSPSPSRLRGLLRFEELGLLLGFVVLILVIGVPNPEFFQLGSIKTLVRQSAFVGIISFGMVFLVSMVEIDLSVGGIYAVSATSSALIIKAGLDPWLAVLIGLCIGASLGAVNGILTVLLGVPLIIVSLGTISVFFGLNLIVSGATAIYGMPKTHPFFTVFGGEWLGIPVAGWILLAIGAVLHVTFQHTRFGATVRAIGSNAAAAEFIGIRVRRTRIWATVLVGFLSALSGIMSLAYFKTADPSMGAGLELQVIAAVVIGGTSLAGGSGSMLGAMLGVLIISAIDSGIVFYGVNPNYSRFVTGCVIVTAIALDRAVKRSRRAVDRVQSHL